MSWISEQVGLFFKHKFYLGTRGAWNLQWDIMRNRPWRVPGFKHPIHLDATNQADVQTFNDVVLKQSYSNIIHPKKDVKRIVDLGANIGLSLIVFLHEFPHAEIGALEPDAGNFKWLEKNIKPYQNEGRKITLKNQPVYSESKNVYLTDPGHGTHGFRISEKKEEGIIAEMKSLTMLAIFEQMGWEKVDLVKVDIEGAEKELFETNTDWIGRVKHLEVETHDRFQPGSTKAVFKALEGFEYSVKLKNENMVIHLNPLQE